MTQLRGDGSPAFVAVMCDTAEIWSDGSAKGYAIQAAQQIGLTQGQTFKLIRAMKVAMDIMSVDDAEKLWAGSPY